MIPLPGTRLGRRHFFVFTRRSEWSGIAEVLAHESISIVRELIGPGLAAALPGLPAKVFDSSSTGFEARESMREA